MGLAISLLVIERLGKVHLKAAASAAEQRITNRRVLEKYDITRYGRWLKNIDFLHYTAFGRVWYGAKYSRRVWEQFAHTFEK